MSMFFSFIPTLIIRRTWSEGFYISGSRIYLLKPILFGVKKTKFPGDISQKVTYLFCDELNVDSKSL